MPINDQNMISTSRYVMKTSRGLEHDATLTFHPEQNCVLARAAPFPLIFPRCLGFNALSLTEVQTLLSVKK